MVFEPRAGYEEQDENNDEPLLWPGQNEKLLHRSA